MIVRCRHFCPQCEQVRGFRRKAVDHPRHRRLTLLTLGAWAVVWLLLSLRPPRRWRCGYCNAAARSPARTRTRPSVTSAA